MPKAKPSQVIVHRIELQEKERELVSAAIGANLTGKAVNAAGIGAVAYIGYKAAKAAYGWTEDIVEDVKEMVDDGLLEPVLGKKTYTDNETGKTYKNPFAGIPVLGSLFGSGINIGIATNPFK